MCQHAHTLLSWRTRASCGCTEGSRPRETLCTIHANAWRPDPYSYTRRRVRPHAPCMLDSSCCSLRRILSAWSGACSTDIMTAACRTAAAWCTSPKIACCEAHGRATSTPPRRNRLASRAPSSRQEVEAWQNHQNRGHHLDVSPPRCGLRLPHDQLHAVSCTYGPLSCETVGEKASRRAPGPNNEPDDSIRVLSTRKGPWFTITEGLDRTCREQSGPFATCGRLWVGCGTCGSQLPGKRRWLLKIAKRLPGIGMIRKFFFDRKRKCKPIFYRSSRNRAAGIISSCEIWQPLPFFGIMRGRASALYKFVGSLMVAACAGSRSFWALAVTP